MDSAYGKMAIDYHRTVRYAEQRAKQRLRNKIYSKMMADKGFVECYVCCQPVEWRDKSLEHKIPKFYGGTYDPQNLTISHRACNDAKGRSVLPRTFEEEPDLVRRLYKNRGSKKSGMGGGTSDLVSRPVNPKTARRLRNRIKNKARTKSRNAAKKTRKYKHRGFSQ